MNSIRSKPYVQPKNSAQLDASDIKIKSDHTIKKILIASLSPKPKSKVVDIILTLLCRNFIFLAYTNTSGIADNLQTGLVALIRAGKDDDDSKISMEELEQCLRNIEEQCKSIDFIVNMCNYVSQNCKDNSPELVLTNGEKLYKENRKPLFLTLDEQIRLDINHQYLPFKANVNLALASRDSLAFHTNEKSWRRKIFNPHYKLRDGETFDLLFKNDPSFRIQKYRWIGQHGADFVKKKYKVEFGPLTRKKLADDLITFAEAIKSTKNNQNITKLSDAYKGSDVELQTLNKYVADGTLKRDGDYTVEVEIEPVEGNIPVQKEIRVALWFKALCDPWIQKRIDHGTLTIDRLKYIGSIVPEALNALQDPSNQALIDKKETTIEKIVDSIEQDNLSKLLSQRKKATSTIS